MQIQLKYFTGTGNSLRILETCKDIFENEGHQVELSEINNGNTHLNESGLIGFCFPVYAFDIPRICRQYLKGINRFKIRQKVFILITAGNANESGFSINTCVKILKNKNCEVIYSEVIEMPINWVTAMNPPNKKDCLSIINKGIIQTKKLTQNILAGIQHYHAFNIPEQYGRLSMYKEYLLFKYLGIYNLWRSFKVYDTCNGCQLCAKNCPTNSIEFIDHKPKWKATCEQCMRCANICPHQAIFQTFGGDTKGKNRYLEPTFKALINNSNQLPYKNLNGKIDGKRENNKNHPANH